MAATEPEPPPGAAPPTVIAEPADDAAHVFDQNTLHVFDLEIAPADLERTDSDPAAEEYVPALLTFEGKTYPAGYRYKGSLGAFFPPCTNFLDGSKDGKCSIKLSFNWMDPEGRFFGLKKLLFHAMNNDPSQLRERLGYAMFREMGVPASRASHAVLRVNGQAELYALIEEIDSRFTRSRFSEGGKGNLYKEIWPIHTSQQAYISALETNENSQPSADRVLRFREAVMQGHEAMAAWMDPVITASYMAVDRLILNDDGAFHFYCFERAIGNNPTAPGNHNYYWYEAAELDRMWIVPWDLDMSMSDALKQPHLETDWRVTPAAAQCNVCDPSSGAGSPASGCDPVIRNFQGWIDAYEAQVDRFIQGPFSKASVEAKLSAWKQQIVSAGFPVDEAAAAELIQILDRSRMNRGFPY
ncbi:MAG: CotH kinase family protein [Polyangiales bacterium]